MIRALRKLEVVGNFLNLIKGTHRKSRGKSTFHRKEFFPLRSEERLGCWVYCNSAMQQKFQPEQLDKKITTGTQFGSRTVAVQ